MRSRSYATVSSDIPLHNQVIPWAMKKNVDLYHRADNRIDMRSVKVN
jgi:peptide/nickel transport system substrate-binding protein